MMAGIVAGDATDHGAFRQPLASAEFAASARWRGMTTSYGAAQSCYSQAATNYKPPRICYHVRAPHLQPGA